MSIRLHRTIPSFSLHPQQHHRTALPSAFPVTCRHHWKIKRIERDSLVTSLLIKTSQLETQRVLSYAIITVVGVVPMSDQHLHPCRQRPSFSTVPVVSFEPFDEPTHVDFRL